LKLITGHVIYNPAYTYKLQLKTTLVLNVDMNVAIDKSAADIDLNVKTEDHESMDDEKDGT
jgi:hypothetical protein